MHRWIATKRVMFRVFPEKVTSKKLSAFLTKAADRNLQVIYISNGGTNLANLLSEYQGITVVPKGPWTIHPIGTPGAEAPGTSRRGLRRIALRVKRSSWVRRVPAFLRRNT
jgi:phosphatidate phosphatase APP1